MVYSDGDEVEKALLESVGSQRKRDNLIRTGIWPFIAHLSPGRENLLNWYDFHSSGNLLEIGGGCGALTGLFTSRVKHVDCIEISDRRAKIIKERYKKLKNLKVFPIDVMKYETDSKYDFITAIGVLEYSGLFIKTKNPALTLLKKICSLMKTNGEFILAIENKFGLKYWAGAPEDHTVGFFESIEGYPKHNGIQTYSKDEISKMLKDTGFSDIFFYYPLPHYHFPDEIFSDQYLPTNNFLPKAGIYPSKHSTNRTELFNEARVARQLIESGYFDIFSNAFLIVAKKSQISIKK